MARPISTSAKVLLFLLEVFRPVFWLIGRALRLIYLVLFSWWFGPLTDRWLRNSFAQQIQQKVPFLFAAQGARVIADPKPYVNDENMSYVCVATAALILKFSKWRDENYGIQVAPTFAPTDFYDLLDAVLLVDPEQKVDRSKLEIDWRYWGKLLEPRFRLLEQAFDLEHFAETKARLLSAIRQHRP